MAGNKSYSLPPWLLLLTLTIGLLISHLLLVPFNSQSLIPENITQVALNMTFEPEDTDVRLNTFLPKSNHRQTLINETNLAPNMEFHEQDNALGRLGNWAGTDQSRSVHYQAHLTTTATRYEIPSDLLIPESYDKGYDKSYDASLAPYLSATDAIQVKHPEIEQLWKNIAPKSDKHVLDVLSAIYDYTYNEITTVPFKGVTDSLTALRLGEASCNGKSRLFISLARLNNLPSRLVGGLILNTGTKKTSHQWVEVFINNYWVPFGPTNGYFAELPAHYLELYRGDLSLFKHNRNINFDYAFTISQDTISPALYQHQAPTVAKNINAAVLLQNLGLTPKTTSIFLLFPLCTLLITFLRNVVGLKTFGIFMPMLVAAACFSIGLTLGLLSFLSVLLLAFIFHALLDKLHILKVARLASIITIITLMFIIALYFIDIKHHEQFGMLTLFPVVIISFVAERLHQLSAENNWPDMISISIGTVFTIITCFLIFNSIVLQGIFALYPELLLLVLSIQMYIGSWSGIRLSEIIRFKNLLLLDASAVVGINSRNRDFVYKHNKKHLLTLAADKLAAKIALQKLNIPVPDTLASCSEHREMEQMMLTIQDLSRFVIKPNKGSQGNGILVIIDKDGDLYVSASGKKWNVIAIRQHINEILSGIYSQDGDTDTAYIEPLIQQHTSLQCLAPYGLSDIRIIAGKGKLISAMLRMPTKRSSGKANLHQGAVGVAIDLETGITTRCSIKGQSITHHPDNGASLVGVSIPFWNEITTMAEDSYRAIPLGYLGVDVCLDKDKGPLILEVNGRPGLEIQNVHNRGFGNELSSSINAS